MGFVMLAEQVVLRLHCASFLEIILRALCSKSFVLMSGICVAKLAGGHLHSLANTSTYAATL
jgi:hypothetical protein